MPQAEYQFAPHERPAFPGSPASPEHPNIRRLGYAAVAVLVGLTATFGNALVTVNISNLSGSLGLYVAQASWLPALYVAMNASANLTLVKARAQFGIPAVTSTLLVLYGAAALWQILLPSFTAAIVVRMVCGMTAAGLSTLTIYNLIQVFPPKLRPLAVVIGVSLPQFASPLARLIPVEMLAIENWRNLYLLEFGIALAALAVLSALPLPPSDRSKAFQPLDFVTIGLMVPASVLICGVLNEGRLLWWTDTPWLGWALAAAIPLLVAAILIERNRTRPLLQTRWLRSFDMLRFASVAVLVRMALAEQSYGAVGLLTSSGLNNDQLRILFSFVIVGMACGVVAAIATLSEKRIPYQVMAAALIIALGAWIDTNATNVTRPPQLYLSQALIAFGTTLFIGPALLYGFIRVLRLGADYLATFVVLFSITQNIGGLAGSALLGTYQISAARAHVVAISEHLIAADPQVVRSLQGGSAALAGTITDPIFRAAEGGSLLARSVTREANILAYNDVFRLVALLALGTAIYIGCLRLFSAWRQRQQTAGARA